jgi:mannosyl-3-phosphoglycerate phosphatase
MQDIIFTDLDGTLLHSKTYSYDEAKPALDMICRRDIPLIFCSSKTRKEIETYRRRLGNRHPFIAENGGGIFIPAEYFPFAVDGELRNGYAVVPLGASYNEIREVFTQLREKLAARVKGFGDMTVNEVAALTGLSFDEAVLAKDREYDEPFLLPHESHDQFLTAITNQGLRWTKGSFYHILGNSDKGKAVRLLKQYYEKKYGGIRTIGLGDAFNDLPLLKEVDFPVLVQKENGRYDPMVVLPNLRQARGIGPIGWNQAIQELLK